MKFNKQLILTIIFLSSAVGLALSLKAFPVWTNRYLGMDYSPEKECEVSFRGDIFCETFEFNSESNSLELSFNWWEEDMADAHDRIILVNFTLTPYSGGFRFCWLAVNETHGKNQLGQPPGFFAQRNMKPKLKLNCTDFNTEDVENGKWKVFYSYFELTNGETSQLFNGSGYILTNNTVRAYRGGRTLRYLMKVSLIPLFSLFIYYSIIKINWLKKPER